MAFLIIHSNPYCFQRMLLRRRVLYLHGTAPIFVANLLSNLETVETVRSLTEIALVVNTARIIIKMPSDNIKVFRSLPIAFKTPTAKKNNMSIASGILLPF